jgi:hypothetical protein
MGDRREKLVLLANFRAVFFREVKITKWAMKIHARPKHMGIHDKHFFARWTCNFDRLTHDLPHSILDFGFRILDF